MTVNSYEDHAEGNAFAQAAAGTARGGHANLYSDRDPCTFCLGKSATHERSVTRCVVIFWCTYLVPQAFRLILR